MNRLKQVALNLIRADISNERDEKRRRERADSLRRRLDPTFNERETISDRARREGG